MAKDPYTYFRVEAREILEGLAQGVLSLEKDGVGKEVICRMLRQAHTLKGAARVVKQVAISESSHAIEDVLARYRDGGGQLPHPEAEQLLRLIDRCGEQLKTLAGAPADATTPVAAHGHEEPIESVRVDIAQLDTTLCDLAEAQVHLEALEQQIPFLEQMRRTTRRLVRRTGGRHNGRGDGEPSTKAAAVAALAEELRTSVEAVFGAIRTGTERVGRDLARIRDRASEFRLLPATTILGSLERSVRDVGEALQKRVAFEMIGGEQRLDAHVLLALRDALIHVVRNAVAHGIESEFERAAAGKPPIGRVCVRVQKTGQRVSFRVEDDGRGLDVDGIRTAAVARGLAQPAAVGSMGLAEVAQLLFRGGLSTSAAVSEFSGRGVGLDMVRATASRLKGEASLRSDAGRGTVVEICVPVSIESLAVLAADAHGLAVLIPFGAIRQVVRAAAGELVSSATGAALLVGDQLIPFQPLGSVLGLIGPKRESSKPRPCSVVIVEAGGSRAAIGVDRLKEVRNVVVRFLPTLCGPVPLVAGATLNGMGNPELVLDAERLVAAVLAGSGPQAQSVSPSQPTVLVVDDSLTTRMLEQNILEAAGFRVELATSGEEGLQRAREKPHSLFVVDVEMPGMNGFELLRRFQGDPQLQGTPAIMVTSRASPDDRRSAQEAGARGYIVKSEFDESRLLQIVRDLIAEVSQ